MILSSSHLPGTEWNRSEITKIVSLTVQKLTCIHMDNHFIFESYVDIIWSHCLNTNNHSHCMIFINYQELNWCIKNLQKCIREEKNKIGSPIQLQTFGKWWYPHSVCPRGIDTEGLCRKNYPDWESYCSLKFWLSWFLNVCKFKVPLLLNLAQLVESQIAFLFTWP